MADPNSLPNSPPYDNWINPNSPLPPADPRMWELPSPLNSPISVYSDLSGEYSWGSVEFEEMGMGNELLVPEGFPQEEPFPFFEDFQVPDPLPPLAEEEQLLEELILMAQEPQEPAPLNLEDDDLLDEEEFEGMGEELEEEEDEEEEMGDGVNGEEDEVEEDWEEELNEEEQEEEPAVSINLSELSYDGFSSDDSSGPPGLN